MTQTLTITPRPTDLGGFSVRRVLPYHKQRSVGPFVFFDHIGPALFGPGQGIDVRPHPHIGLSTVTFLFEGALGHKDTVGSDIVIRPGAVNWMTAGRGICHSERTPQTERDTGQRLHGIQTWVALPMPYEESEPAFVHHPASTLPKITRGGAVITLIAGQGWAETSPVRFPHPILYAAIEAEGPAAIELPSETEERAIYLIEGTASLNGRAIDPLTMVVLTPDTPAVLTVDAGTRAMVCGGAPLDAPRFMDWNFVSSSKARIEQAKADWRASAMNGWIGTPFALPPGEDEHIPLPGDPD
jgi:redox-sensitive bicupin YhaK (pirin superfamily)